MNRDFRTFHIYQVVLAFMAFIVLLFWFVQYMNAKSHCSHGIIVNDAIGMPVCVSQPAVLVTP